MRSLIVGLSIAGSVVAGGVAARPAVELPEIELASLANEDSAISLHCDPASSATRPRAWCHVEQLSIARTGDVCRLVVSRSAYTFEQIDADTWRAIETLPLCGATVTLTVSRSGNLWDYTQETKQPTAPGIVCSVPAAPSLRFAHSHRRRAMGCSVVEF